MKKLLALTVASTAFAFAAPAFASSSNGLCGNTPNKWMAMDAARQIAVEQGYDVRRIKREDGCYEVYAISRDGAKVELYMHPTSGDIVKIKTKS